MSGSTGRASRPLAAGLAAAVLVVGSVPACRTASRTDGRTPTERGEVAETPTEGEVVVPADLRDTGWRLVRFDGMEADPSLPEITLAFEADKAVGMAGCNRYTGWLEEVGAGRIAIGPLAATRKACPERIMEREGRYLAALEAISRYELSDGRLTLFHGENGETGRLEFEPEPGGGSVTPSR